MKADVVACRSKSIDMLSVIEKKAENLSSTVGNAMHITFDTKVGTC